LRGAGAADSYTGSVSTTEDETVKLCLICLRHLGDKSYASQFCTQRCYNESNYRNNVQAWLAGDPEGVTRGRLPRYVRKWLFEQRGSSCEKCGWAEVNPTNNRVPIEVNHIDGDADNHKPENLELLCPNCHSLTPTYGVLNRGNGRKSRKLRTRGDDG
jgi:5-methylcytosine-specific restriction endonuclease McrA